MEIKYAGLETVEAIISEIQTIFAKKTELTPIEGDITAHKTDAAAHSDIRDLITGLGERLNALANSDDETLDQMAEIVTYIKSNRDLIDSITTSKVNVADIINDLETNVTNKPLSAAQGVALKSLIDGIVIPVQSVNGKTGAVSLGASDVGADASGTADTVVTTHNTSATAHEDLFSAKASASTLSTITLSATAWVGITAPFTQTISVETLGAEQNGIINVAHSATASQREAARQAMLSVSAQAAGTITVCADGEMPETDIPVSIILLG